MKGLNERGRQRLRRNSGAVPVWNRGLSMRPKADNVHDDDPVDDPAVRRPVIHLQPMSDLDLMIRNGWGETPQERIPADWRTRPNMGGRRKA